MDPCHEALPSRRHQGGTVGATTAGGLHQGEAEEPALTSASVMQESMFLTVAGRLLAPPLGLATQVVEAGVAMHVSGGRGDYSR